MVTGLVSCRLPRLFLRSNLPVICVCSLLNTVCNSDDSNSNTATNTHLPLSSGDSANAGLPIDPSVQTSLSNGAGSPRLNQCLSDISMGNSRFFSYEELYQITDGFSAHKLLGEGGFGSVYKGHLPDGTDVAIKRLKDGGGQGEREFQAEVEIISRVHHRHLVSLVGYCISNNQRLLVYDFVPNNTLHYHLHGML